MSLLELNNSKFNTLMKNMELKWFDQYIIPTPHFPCADVRWRKNAALLDSLGNIAFLLSLKKQVLLVGGFLNTPQADYRGNPLSG